LIDAVNNRINEISQNPARYPKKKNNYPEVSIEKFPFVLIYEILEKEKAIFVSYIFHTKRNPKLKFKR
jgi:ParE toxin of type II toxin-antitoxin system, parDE